MCQTLMNPPDLFKALLFFVFSLIHFDLVTGYFLDQMSDK